MWKIQSIYLFPQRVYYLIMQVPYVWSENSDKITQMHMGEAGRIRAPPPNVQLLMLGTSQ